jgi:hypothetical protein
MGHPLTAGVYLFFFTSRINTSCASCCNVQRIEMRYGTFGPQASGLESCDEAQGFLPRAGLTSTPSHYLYSALMLVALWGANTQIMCRDAAWEPRGSLRGGCVAMVLPPEPPRKDPNHQSPPLIPQIISFYHSTSPTAYFPQVLIAKHVSGMHCSVITRTWHLALTLPA